MSEKTCGLETRDADNQGRNRSGGSMNALEEFREMIEEHWPHDNPYWREGEMKFAPTIDAIADRIEAEYTPNSEIAAKYIKLPLDADGVPVKPGDSMESGGAKFVAETFVWRQLKKGIASFGCGHCLIGDGGYKADHCHHVEQPKLTKEDIDAKAKVGWAIDYWMCRGTSCAGCPSRIEGKIPRDYYDVRSCEAAMVPDILRLERERVESEQA